MFDFAHIVIGFFLLYVFVYILHTLPTHTKTKSRSFGRQFVGDPGGFVSNGKKYTFSVGRPYNFPVEPRVGDVHRTSEEIDGRVVGYYWVFNSSGVWETDIDQEKYFSTAEESFFGKYKT